MKACHKAVGGHKKFSHLYFKSGTRKFRGRMLTDKEREGWHDWIAKSIDGQPYGRKLTLKDVK